MSQVSVRGSSASVGRGQAVNQAVAMHASLKNKGTVVTIAGNGREALTTLWASPCSSRFDLMSDGYQMPEMDGFEATAAIREQERTCQEPPADRRHDCHAMKGDRERCLAAGMDD